MPGSAEPDVTPHRSDPVQQGPPADLSGFPVRTGLAGAVIYRQHELREKNPDNGCWYFDGHAPGVAVEGRFSLTAERGTCYLAETDEVAAREHVGRLLASGLPVPYGHVKGRVVSTVPCPSSAEPAADALAPAASTMYRVTRELFTTPDYSLGGSWADALDAAGFSSLIYQPRFSTGSEFAIAVFSDRGAQPSRPVTSYEPLVEVLERMGVTVLHRPSSSDAAVDDTAPC